MAIHKSVTPKAKKRSPGKGKKWDQAPPLVHQHKDKIIKVFIEKAEEGSCPHAKLLFDPHAGLAAEPPGAETESDLASLLLEQLKIEQQKSEDEPVAAEAPALK